MTQNRLGDETSPYLLQHKDNPVHWHAWGDAAFEAAERDNRPILLSIGYAACHWCHVMAHESFEDGATAAVMNELFVNIKVDREERPDLDAIYQNALALLGEQGGWPLTMFLTPDGRPFWGGTYFPREARFGRPAFQDVLRHIAKIYREEPDKIEKNVDAIGEALRQVTDANPGDDITPALVDQIAQRLIPEVDHRFGGIGGAPKFPHGPLFELLWRAWVRSGNEQARDAVLVTLDRMSEGGIYDHLGGGFARYSTDARWLVPHFEKMLYDNAQMIDLLTLVWQETKKPLYAARVAETIDWVRREMTVPEGGFASTLDADSEGVEGKFYVWREREIDTLLGADADAFKKAYDVTPHGNWEEATILNRPADLEPGGAVGDETLEKCRRILFEARAKRIRPGYDDKVLADWNGLMIAAMANAGLAFARPDWVDAARRAFDFVTARMVEDGRLRHSWRHGKLKHPATLDDYANMARAALMLFETTSDETCLDTATALVQTLDRHYLDPGDGAYFFAADDTARLIVRAKTATDNAVPSGNGTMVGVLSRLYYLTGEPRWRDKATALVRAFSGDVARNFIPLATLVNNAEFLADAAQIVLVAGAGQKGAEPLRRLVFESCVPNRIFRQVDPDADLPDGHPARGKGQVYGQPTVYVCRGPVCSPPVTGPQGLKKALAAR